MRSGLTTYSAVTQRAGTLACDCLVLLFDCGELHGASVGALGAGLSTRSRQAIRADLARYSVAAISSPVTSVLRFRFGMLMTADNGT